MLARFCETIPTVKSVLLSEIRRINFIFLTEITIFVTEIMIFPFFQKLEFLGSYRNGQGVLFQHDSIRVESVYVRGVWVPMSHERINEVLQIKDPKNGSKLLEEPNHDKIVDFLTGGKGKWNSTKKNMHESIHRGSLIEESKVWFYFIAYVIIPTKHLSTIRENEVILLYALLKGYKFDVGKLLKHLSEPSIRL